MARKLVVKPISELSEQEFKACYRLNLRGAGRMRGLLSTCRYNGIGLAHMMFERKQLVGWALQSPQRIGNLPRSFEVMVFVKRGYRRKGIGTQLIESVKAHSQKRRLDISHYSREAAAFFESNRLRSNRI